MGESHNNLHHCAFSSSSSSSAASRLGLGIRTTTTSSTASEIVEAHDHILRATGHKDRHSKVCTAKGPRDGLAAHTAIQFYDVQDQLGYDRPNKVVDWLIKKAKAAIDELEELPPWNPVVQTSTTSVEGRRNRRKRRKKEETEGRKKKQKETKREGRRNKEEETEGKEGKKKKGKGSRSHNFGTLKSLMSDFG